MKLLFVCLGNICRSPTAEGVMRHLLAVAGHAYAHVEVDSAGCGDWHAGEPPDRRTIHHAKLRGYDLAPLRARMIQPADFMVFDRVYAMDQANLRHLTKRVPPEHAHKLSLFLDVLGAPGSEVPDPWAGGPEGFEEVLDLVERACKQIMPSLQARAG